MDHFPRLESHQNTSSHRSLQNYFSAPQFLDTFQPSSYSNISESRNQSHPEDAKGLERSSIARSHSSLGQNRGLIESSRLFHNRVPSDPQVSRSQQLEMLIQHKDSMIEELKFQKHSLSQEIDELIDRIKLNESQKEAERKGYLNKIEELKYAEKENEQVIRSLQQELEEVQKQCEEYKERVDRIKPSGEIEELLRQNKELKYTLEAKKFDQKSEFIIFKLNEQIKELREANENLSLSLASRPTAKDLKDKAQTISELKDQLKQRMSRSRSTSQTRENNRQNIKKDKELFTLNIGEVPSLPTLNILLTDLLTCLKLQNFSEILPTVKNLKKRCKGSDLEERLARLVKDLSPDGSFHPLPSPQQSWKWVRRVVEEYLVLKKDFEREERNKAIVNRLLGALGVVDSSMIIKEVNTLIGENHASRAILEKVDVMLENNPNAMLKDFKYLVNEIL